MKKIFFFLLATLLCGQGFVKDNSEWGWKYVPNRNILLKGEFVRDDTIHALSDPLSYKQWYLDNLNYTEIPTDWLDALQYNTNTVKIYVVDTGFPHNEDLQGVRFEKGGNYALIYQVSDTCGCGREDTIYYPSQNKLDDENGHATAVGGIIGANYNDLGITGLDRSTPIKFIKVLRDGGWGYLSWLIFALQEIDREVDSLGITGVVNLSLGSYLPNRVLEDFIAYLEKKGRVILVCAAGNNGSEGLDYPAQYSHRGYAKRDGYSNVISVGALNRDEKKSSYSSFGDDVDVWAYGGVGQIYNQKTYQYSWGESIFTTAPDSTVFYTNHFTNPDLYPYNYGYFAGTSASAPMVTGALSRFFNYYGNYDLKKLKDYIRRTGTEFTYRGWTEDKDGVDYENGLEYTGYKLDLSKFWFDVNKPLNVETPKDYNIQVYPNPFNASAIVNYNLQISQFMTIKLYNIVGQEILDYSKFQEKGNHELMIDGSNKTSGIYLLRINNEIRKLLLLK